METLTDLKELTGEQLDKVRDLADRASTRAVRFEYLRAVQAATQTSEVPIQISPRLFLELAGGVVGSTEELMVARRAKSGAEARLDEVYDAVAAVKEYAAKLERELKDAGFWTSGLEVARIGAMTKVYGAERPHTRV